MGVSSMNIKGNNNVMHDGDIDGTSVSSMNNKGNNKNHASPTITKRLFLV